MDQLASVLIEKSVPRLCGLQICRRKDGNYTITAHEATGGQENLILIDLNHEELVGIANQFTKLAL